MLKYARKRPISVSTPSVDGQKRTCSCTPSNWQATRRWAFRDDRGFLGDRLAVHRSDRMIGDHDPCDWPGPAHVTTQRKHGERCCQMPGRRHRVPASVVDVTDEEAQSGRLERLRPMPGWMWSEGGGVGLLELLLDCGFYDGAFEEVGVHAAVHFDGVGEGELPELFGAEQARRRRVPRLLRGSSSCLHVPVADVGAQDGFSLAPRRASKARAVNGSSASQPK